MNILESYLESLISKSHTKSNFLNPPKPNKPISHYKYVHKKTKLPNIKLAPNKDATKPDLK